MFHFVFSTKLCFVMLCFSQILKWRFYFLQLLSAINLPAILKKYFGVNIAPLSHSMVSKFVFRILNIFSSFNYRKIPKSRNGVISNCFFQHFIRQHQIIIIQRVALYYWSIHETAFKRVKWPSFFVVTKSNSKKPLLFS